MHPKPLRAAFGKVEWAIAQIDQLNGQIDAFLRDAPYRLVINIEPDGASVEPIKVWRIELARPIPDHIYAQVGVILGLLREPLDQAVAATCKNESGVAFVFGRTRQEFEIALAKSKKIPADVQALIAESEPFFEGSGHLLAALNYLKKPDKHRSDLVPVVLRSVIHARRVEAHWGPIYTFGPRTGTHLRLDPLTNNFTYRGQGREPDFQIQDGVEGTVLEGNPSASLKDRMELATSALGAELKADFKPTFSIAFSEVARVNSEPITSVLTQMRDFVEGLLLAFERRFFG